MKYITIKGIIKNNYIKSDRDVYWLTKPSNIFSEGFALLEKTWQGSYNLLKFLKIKQKSLSALFFGVSDSGRRKKGESRIPPPINGLKIIFQKFLQNSG